MIGIIMSKTSAPERMSTVEFLAIGACFTNYMVKSTVKRTVKSITRSSKKTAI